MHSKTRYNIGLAKRRGVVIKRSKDIARFTSFWQKSAKKRGMFLSMKKEIESLYFSFGDDAMLLFAEYEKKLAAAVFLIDTSSTRYYIYAASTPLGNKYFAPSLLVWESLKNAKNKNLKMFDFEGIYDERFPLPAWKGFTRFKKGFGGKEVEYLGKLHKYFFFTFLRHKKREEDM